MTTRIVVTGGAGFLGWHLRCRAHALGGIEVLPYDLGTTEPLADLVARADAVIHLAGVNRGTDEEVEQGNIRLGEELAAALRATDRPLPVAYSNTIHASRGDAYGRGKSAAGALIAAAVADTGGRFHEVFLPNLFGEHGRPSYNSFVATFCHAVANDLPVQSTSAEVPLLHAQQAAAVLLGAISDAATPAQVWPAGEHRRVDGILAQLRHFAEVYGTTGEIPELPTAFDVALFNTFRSFLFPARYPIMVPLRTDQRGGLVECVRVRGGQGQSFLSTTNPGYTRGEHYHLRKIERFLVVGGRARISLRKMFTDEIISFDVDGTNPAIIDMPTMWTHNITNTGDGTLTTVFWINELFNPADTDTHAEPVGNARNTGGTR